MTWLRKRGYAKEDDHASNDTPDRTFAEVLAQLATQRGTLENVKDDTGEREGPAVPAGPVRDEAVTRHGFNFHASLTISADDDPAGLPVSATAIARGVDGASVPMPNVLSTRHIDRIAGGLLYAATSNVPWAMLLARTFEIDVKACTRCGGRLEVRAVVTDHDIARRILAAIPTTARAPPPIDSALVHEPALA